MMDLIIACHCAPALAGIKPANIFTCCKKEYPTLKEDLELLNCELNKKDIYLEILCECSKRAIVILYRAKVIKDYLKRSDINSILTRCGYPSDGDFEELMGKLKERMRMKNEFPHEIGAFLGYPAEDIYGFINHKNENCLYTGYWRVYGDVEKCKECFRRYDKCRAAVLKRVERGQTIASIFCAA